MTQTPNDPDSESTAGASTAQKVRRRVSSEQSEEHKGRSGCLLTGAILGIIVGATFAFYGLPPILKHFYGEEHIAIGQPYVGDAKTITADFAEPRDIQPTPNVQTVRAMVVLITVTTNKTWTPTSADFSIEYGDGGNWVDAIGVNYADPSAAPVRPGAPPHAPVDFDQSQLGVKTQLAISFPIVEASRGDPTYLHLTSPRVRFALPTAQATSAK